MESIKARPGGFSTYDQSCAYRKNGSLKAKKKKSLLNLTERKVINDLEALYLETLKLTVEKDKRMYKLKQEYEAKHEKIFDERFQILQNFRQNFPDELKSKKESKCFNFWMTVLKNSALGIVTKRDENILKHLVDVRSKLVVEPEIKFTLEFHFETNDYFRNEVLTKTFFIECEPKEDNLFSYDGPNIVRCEGCDIKWKASNPICSSVDFLMIFSPPVLNKELGMSQFLETMRRLENDFHIGFYLKENLIPKAVLLFTQEMGNADEESVEEPQYEFDSIGLPYRQA